MRILHVEDDQDILTLTSALLEGVAMVDGVTTLAGARHMLETRAYDLLLVDLLLPDARDVEAVKVLARYHVPIVVVSGAGDPEILSRAAQAGAADYVVKPIRDTHDFMQRLHFVHSRRLRSTVGRRIACDAFERMKPFITCDSRGPWAVPVAPLGDRQPIVA